MLLGRARGGPRTALLLSPQHGRERTGGIRRTVGTRFLGVADLRHRPGAPRRRRPVLVGAGGLWTPRGGVELFEVQPKQPVAQVVEELQPIFHTHAGCDGATQQVTAIRRPRAIHAAFVAILTELGLLEDVPEVQVAGELPEAAQAEEAAEWAPPDGVPARSPKVQLHLRLLPVVESHITRQVALQDQELVTSGAPSDVVDGALLLTHRNISGAVGTHEEEARAAVVALAALVDLCARPHQKRTAREVPKDGHGVGQQ
mmetsp:Transcript_24997/g.83457  ORF Transcript_24997/g.83457 Transcript_24997/m.83457 type:complete len:258 (-) Transcript_24997:1002-1775(-)